MRRVLEGAARRIRQRIERAGVGIGAEIRTAQLRMVLAEIRRIIGDTWTGPILDATQAGRKAATEAAETAVEALTAVAYTALPPDVAKALTDGLGAAARSSIANAFARVPRSLSARVYHNAALARGHVERTVREGVAAGLTAKELARDVYQYVSPTTPGGMSYAAMRLARTEINNAFHERQKAGANRPGVKAVKWNLSGSHKVPDECNVYAAHKPYDKDAVPDKPHPQCFCYLTYVMMSPDEFAEALSSGSFDDELDRRTRENMARLGREATPAPTTRPTPPSAPLQSVDSYEARMDRALKGTDVLDSVKSGLPVRGSLTRQQRQSLQTYESTGFVVINGFLRRGGVIEDDFDKRTQLDVDRIDSAMYELPQDVQTWRGVSSANKLFGDRLNNDLTGFEWQELAYGSTSAVEKVANDFMVPRPGQTEVKMRILVRKGTKGTVISRGPLSQSELLLERNTRWRVVKDRGVNAKGQREIDVEAYHVRQDEDTSPAGWAIHSASDTGTRASSARSEVSTSTEEVVNSILARNRDLVPTAFNQRFNGVYVMNRTQAKAFSDRYGPSALGGYTVESSEIGIHPQVLKPKYQREYDRDKRSGFLSQTGDNALRSFVAHETGHHVDKVLKERGPAAVKAVWTVIAEVAGVPRPLLTDQTSLDRWVAKHRTKIESVVSRYGGEDAGELIAEVWAEFIDGPNPRSAIRKVGKAIVNAIEG
jgi:hypothetical protein